MDKLFVHQNLSVDNNGRNWLLWEWPLQLTVSQLGLISQYDDGDEQFVDDTDEFDDDGDDDGDNTDDDDDYNGWQWWFSICREIQTEKTENVPNNDN